MRVMLLTFHNFKLVTLRVDDTPSFLAHRPAQYRKSFLLEEFGDCCAKISTQHLLEV